MAAGCVFLELLGTGCGRKDASTTAATGTLAAPAVSVEPEAPTAAKLRAIAVGCQINVENSTIGACKNDERQALVREINAGTVDRASALETLVAALESDDKTRQTVAAKVLEGAFRTSLGKLARAGSLSPELSSRLLPAVLKLDLRQAQQAIPAAVHVAVVTGQGELLMRTLETYPNDEVRVAAYPHVLRYGGSSLLEPVQRLIAIATPRVAAAAFEAMRRMPEPTEAEQQRLCDFGKANVKDPRDLVAAKALSMLATCKGAYADGALAEVQRRASTHQLSGDVIRSLDPICTASNGERAGTASQCARVRALLERVLNNKRQSDEARAAALLSLGVQFPDARTRALAERMAGDPATRVSKTAARVTAGIAQFTPGK